MTLHPSMNEMEAAAFLMLCREWHVTLVLLDDRTFRRMLWIRGKFGSVPPDHINCGKVRFERLVVKTSTLVEETNAA